MVRLERRLDIRHYEAVGLLELLWHLTTKEAPAGNIGKLSDEDIAISLGWEFEPDVLIDALCQSQWLDRSETYRLVIHDWAEHCEDSVHTKLARSRTTFVDGRLPSFSKFSKKQQDLYDKAVREGDFKPPRAHKNASMPLPCAEIPPRAAVPNHALPNQTKPECVSDAHTPPTVITSEKPLQKPRGIPDPGCQDFELRFDKIYLAHVVTGYKAEAKIRYIEIVTNSVDQQAVADSIDRAHDLWMKYFRVDPKAYKPSLSKWFEDDYYLRAPPAAAVVRRKESRTEQLERIAAEMEAET